MRLTRCPPAGRSPAKERGIRKTRYGWEVYVRVKGQFASKQFPLDTDLEDLRRWRDERVARRKFKIPDPVVAKDTFAHDCQRYLAAVAGMPTYKDRARRILFWRDELGPDRARSEITAAEIRAVLERQRTAKRAPGTLNLLRTALMHLYRVLDGKAATNPVRDVPRYREIPPPLKLPTVQQATKAIRRLRGKGRYRLRVMLWTGWPPAQVMKLTAGDIDWQQQIARVSGRQKGQGTSARWLPLLPQAVWALRAFDYYECYGNFSTHALLKMLHHACDSACVPRFRVYDLRHLFGTRIAQLTKDDRVVAELLQHSSLTQTRRYTEQSVSPRLREAMRQLSGKD
jgi:integrase